MLRRGVVSAAIVSAPMVLGACSLLLGEGYTDPDPGVAGDSGTPEAGDATTAVDGGANDATSVTSDAAIVDSPTDAAPGACPSGKVSFCDDFERVTAQGDWSGTYEMNGGSVVTVASGSGRRLQSSVSAVGAKAFLARTFAIVPTHLHLELTMEFAAVPGVGAVHIVGAGMLGSGGGSPSIVYVYADVGGIWFVQQKTDNQTTYRRDKIPMSAGAPHRLVIDVTFGGNATVTVDGSKVLDLVTQSYLVPANPEVSIGTSELDGQPGTFTVDVDDFVFTAD